MTIHRPSFGRRTTAFGRRPVPPVRAEEVANDAPAKRILPEELWDGPHGDTLREAGLNPDDPANHKPTQADADAIQSEQIELQRQFLETVNAQLPDGTRVVAYAMLPWELWNTRYGHMLVQNCGLHPQQPWNTMLLAADQRASVVLDLPEHPGGYPADLLPQLERLLGELQQEMNVEIEAFRATGSTSWDSVMAWHEAWKAAVPKIIAMSHYVGQMCVGEQAFARHKKLFGATLGWPGCE